MYKMIIITIVSVFIIACKQQVVDGPPKSIPQNKHSTKPIKPHYEPKSKYGNPETYHVLGKTYNVLNSSEGFKQRGKSSWYGTKFHKKRTSSGEPYDMFAMTAAHKTLPLPTYIKVKNIENNKEIVVKVNDRGPFHDDRILDLSYSAAKALGIIAAGTALVEIEAIHFSSKSKNPKLFLQVGAFSNKAKAQLYQEELQNLLSKTSITIEKKGALYALIMGPFIDSEQRSNTRQILQQHGISSSFSFLR